MSISASQSSSSSNSASVLNTATATITASLSTTPSSIASTATTTTSSLPTPGSQAQADAVNNDGLAFALQLASGGDLTYEDDTGKLEDLSTLGTSFSLLDQIAVAENGQYLCIHQEQSGLYLCNATSPDSEYNGGIPLQLVLYTGNIFTPTFAAPGTLVTGQFYEASPEVFAGPIQTDPASIANAASEGISSVAVGAHSAPYATPVSISQVASYARSYASNVMAQPTLAF